MISNDNKTKLNKMNRASQNVLLGDIIQGLQAGYTLSGSFAVSASTSGYALSVNQSSSGSLVRFGTATDNVIFENDGSMRFSGSATTWNDIFFPLTTAKQGQTDKPPFNNSEVAYMFPAGDTSHIMYIIGQMPHSYKEGSAIHPHVHWSQARSGSPVFKLDYKWFNIGEDSSGSFTTISMDVRSSPYTSGCVQQLSGMNAAGIDGTGKKISSLLLMRLYRDDTAYAGDVTTYQFDIHYEMDTLGSRLLATK